MKSLILSKGWRQLAGVAISTCLIAGVAQAADNTPTSSTTDTPKGAGASRMSTTGETAGESAASMMGVTSDAKGFVRHAMEGNAAEIALAQVAERKTQNQELKQLARMIRQDHEQANQNLQPIAQAHGVASTPSLADKHQKKLDRLQKLSGSEFDKEYAKEMLKAHQKEIAIYERASQQLKEQDVKQYAQTTLAKLQQHQQHAKQAAQSAGVDQATITSLTRDSGAMGGTDDDDLELNSSRKSDLDSELKKSD